MFMFRAYPSLLLLSLLLIAQLRAEDLTLVSRGPGKAWKEMPTRTLADLPDLSKDRRLGKFGGIATSAPQKTGFFHTQRKNGRWWLVDPEGLPYIHRGVTSVRETRTKEAAKILNSKFGSKQEWARATGEQLKQHGFNSIGPWSDEETVQPAKQGLAYSEIWNFMSSYGKQRGGTYQKSGHIGYPNDCPFIFDPEFAPFCEKRAERLTATKDDPWLLGHFTDNELPWNINMLDRYLSLPQEDHGYRAAAAWLKKRHGKDTVPNKWSEEDRLAFVGYAADTYFSIVCQAIRRHDPNHLILGSRFHGSALRVPSLFEAAGKHVDIISANYYHRWTPEQTRIHTWSESANKPILITEWYAKGEDSGMGNTSGAGWLVKTQADRGRFYQNFTLGLLQSKVCVGWHWFRYSDNAPNQKGTDPSNRDANKGIVTAHYEAYPTLLQDMKAINERAYGLALFFDKENPAP